MILKKKFNITCKNNDLIPFLKININNVMHKKLKHFYSKFSMFFF